MTFSWELPYPSSRQPVMARNVVATSQPLAAQAGLDVLRRGGNAVDAALAAAITLTVVEPTMNGIGSDAFALVWKDHGLQGLNASGRSPRAWTPDRFRGLPSMPRFGWDAVTVPGCVSAWVALSERFGRLPFERLFDEAIRHAREGFAVSPITAGLWAEARERYAAFGEWQHVFCPLGRAPRPGEVVRLPDHARTLESIASTRGDSFYRGALAETIAAASAREGGALTAEDLATHQCDWVDPIGIGFASHDVHEIPPNGQGLATLMALGMLNHTPLGHLQPDSADAIHLQIEAMKLAFADAHRYIADPAHMDVRTTALLDPAYLERRARLIDLVRAGTPEHGTPTDRGTVLVCAADAEGTMVSLIQSNFGGFGSGVVVPGTGIALQNRASGFSLQPGHPNEVGGGKRPFHTIIPAFATRNGEPVMAFGVMGGPFQPQGHVQMAVRLLLHHQNPQAASDAPRWKMNEGLEVSLEHGFAPAVAEELARRGHRVRREDSAGFGGAQIIARLADGVYCAGSDHRKDGGAVGF